MKRDKGMSDATFRALLSGYRRPSLDRAAFDAWVDEGLASAPASARRSRAIPSRYVPGILALAAALPVFIGLGVFLSGVLGMDAALLAYGPGRAGSRTLLRSDRSPRAIDTSGGGEIELRTANESVIIGPGSRLRVDQDPWRAVNGKKGYRYGIETGSLYIDHDIGSPPFLVRTPLGDVRPVGTILSLKLDDVSLEIACVEGRVAFHPRNGGKDILIAAGELLSVALPSAPPSAGHASSSGAAIDPAPRVKAWVDRTILPSHPSPAPSAPPDVRLIELWTVSLSSDIEKLEAGESVLALLSGETLSFRDPATGAERARADLGARAEGLTLDGDAFALVGKSLRRIDVSTGTERWRSDAGPISFSNIAAAEGMVAVASADGYLYLLSSADGRSVKKISAGAGMYGTPLIYGNAVISSGVDKTLRAFDSRTGSALWTLTGEGRFTGDRPLLLGEGKTVLDADSSGGLFAADSVSGALLWKGSYLEPMAAGPFAAGSLAAYEDSSGIRFIDKEGSVKTPSGIDGFLLAAAQADEGILLATAKGVWLVDSGNPGGKAKALARIGLSLAAFRGEGIYAVDSSGKLRAWKVSR